MTTEQVPLAEQIKWISRDLCKLEVFASGRSQEAFWHDVAVQRAVLVTLQQHQRAMAVLRKAQELFPQEVDELLLAMPDFQDALDAAGDAPMTTEQDERIAEARQKAYLDAMGCCTPEPGEAWSCEATETGDLIWGRICDIGNRASRPLTVTKPLVTAYEAGKADAAADLAAANERSARLEGALQNLCDWYSTLLRDVGASAALCQARAALSPAGTVTPPKNKDAG